MTKKEFIKNLFKEIGLEIIQYEKDTMVVVDRYGDKTQVLHYTDKHTHVDGSVTYSIKFKSRTANFTVDDVRKFRAHLMQRGFECTLDSYTATMDTCMGHQYPNESEAIIVKCVTLPWHQTAEPMTDDEAVEDALTESKRYKPVGYLGEDEEDETCM